MRTHESIPPTRPALTFGLLALTLALAFAPPAAAGWEEGMAAFHEERYEAAAAEFMAGVARQPEESQWHLMLGRCLLELGKPGEAALSLERAVTLAKETEGSQGVVLLARARLATNDPAGALAALERRAPEAVEEALRPAFAQMLALAASRLADVEAARPALEKAAAAIPGEPNLWLALGAARQAAGNLPAALEAFTRSFELKPTLPAGQAAVAVAVHLADAADEDAARQAGYARALAVADRLPALDDSYATRLAAGEAHLSAQGYAAAAEHFAAAARHDPASPLPSYYLGLCARERGDLAGALRHLAAAAAHQPDRELVRRLADARASVYYRQGDYAKAAAAYRAAGNEAGVRTSERALSAAASNEDFTDARRDCQLRLARADQLIAEMERLGVKAEVRNAQRGKTKIMEECHPYLQPG